jgi:hypothetical protein
MPGPAPGSGVRCDGEQGASNVTGVGPAVRRLQVCRGPRPFAGEDPRQHEQRHRRHRTGAQIVRSAHLDGADPAGPVRVERLVPDPDPHLTLLAVRLQRHGFGDRAGDRAVAVEVAGGDQQRTAGLRRPQQRGGQRRPVGDPPGIGRPRAARSRRRPRPDDSAHPGRRRPRRRARWPGAQVLRRFE